MDTMEDNTNNAYPNFSPMKNQDGRYAAVKLFVERVDIIKVETIDRIADLFGLDPGLVFKIIHTQYVQKIKNTTHSKTHKAAKRKKTKNQ
jgi:hypothetical protein